MHTSRYEVQLRRTSSLASRGRKLSWLIAARAPARHGALISICAPPIIQSRNVGHRIQMKEWNLPPCTAPAPIRPPNPILLFHTQGGRYLAIHRPILTSFFPARGIQQLINVHKDRGRRAISPGTGTAFGHWTIDLIGFMDLSDRMTWHCSSS